MQMRGQQGGNVFATPEGTFFDMEVSNKNIECKYEVVYTGKVMVENNKDDSYGINVISKNGVYTIDNVSNDKEYVRRIADYLGVNEVSPEHLMQVLEEVLCSYPYI